MSKSVYIDIGKRVLMMLFLIKQMGQAGNLKTHKTESHVLNAE